METSPEVDVVLPGAEVAGEPLLADGEAAPELAEGDEGCPSPEELLEELGGHGYVLNGIQRTSPNGEAPVSESQLARAGEDEEGEEEDVIEELVAMEPGQMRLQGSFTGVATTHSHQLDLAVGLDVEMPSEMAAEAIRQISRRSRSSSPDKRARLASPSPQRPLELPDERRTLWNTLSDFFRRDAREGARHAAAASPPRSLPDIRLKMDDASSLKQESQRLALDLESSQGQAAQLEAQLLLLTEERDGLRSRLEVLTQEFSEQAMHMDGLRDQSARVLSSGDTLQGELAEREAEVREVQARLAEATQGFDAARADLTKEQLSRDRLESSLAAARRSHELIAEENRALKVQAAELSAQVETIAASLEGRMQVVQQSLDLSEQQLTAVRCERDGLAARVMALEADHGEQGSQARAAAEARAQALEVQVRELQEEAAE